MNNKIFVRKIKSGYLATHNGVKGKAKKMFKAIERAVENDKKRNLNENTSSENQPRSVASQS